MFNQTIRIMKNAILSFAIVLFAAFAGNAQEAVQVGGGPELTVDKEVHDYGTIEQGANGECKFKVTNTGDAPLILSRCKGSCGCTVPKCDPQPIQPGEFTLITVKYDTKRLGPINKSVTITSNATNVTNGNKVVRIKGKIIAKPDSSAPTKEVPAGVPTMQE